jgi:uncharacterized protein (TIGR00369 family)
MIETGVSDAALRHWNHDRCFACGKDAHGLGLRFVACNDHADAVETQVTIGESFEGYVGVVHGGIVATLLDAAMTHCLMAKGIRAVTAALNVRYKHPMRSGMEAGVRAMLVSWRHPVYELKAWVETGGTTLAVATARFFAKDES